MKTKISLLITLCAIFATTIAFGQATFVWTNGSGGNVIDFVQNVDMNAAANWNPNGNPNPNSGPPGDTLMFDGQTTGPLFLKNNTGFTGNGGGAAGQGLVLYMTSNQVSPLTIYYPGSGASSGLRLHGITIDAGAGQLQLGGTTNNTFGYSVAPPNSLDLLFGEANGDIQPLINNSAFPAIIHPNTRIRYGGAGAHPLDFGGTGDWWVTNDLRNANSSATLITKDGPGTLKWMYSVQLAENGGLGNGPFNFNQGTVILLSGNLLQGVTGTINHNATVVKWDTGGDLQTPPVTNGTIAMNINGTGNIEVDSGTLTLSGNNTYTGTNILKGGELIAGSVETANPSGPLGEPGTPGEQTISFQGGILGYSSFNGFDYSPRFDTSAGQKYKVDTGGANVTWTNNLASSGGTFLKLGAGSLTLGGANTYNGNTTINGGKLVIAGTAGTGSINVNDGAALGVVENGTPLAPSTLTLGTSFGATLEVNNITNLTAAPIAAASLLSAGTTTINANNGKFRTIGQTFPLLAWSSGTAPGTILGFLGGAGGHLVTNLNQINLVIDQPPYIWTGGNNSTWDTSTPNNWVFSGSSVPWANGNFALFDDTLTANPDVVVSGVVSGKIVTFANNSTNYSLTSSPGNVLGGSSSLTMGGSGTTTLIGGTNTYTGVTTITGGGTLSVGTLANGGTASDIGAATSTATNLVLNGGTLVYTGGGATVDRLFTLGTASGTIDDESGSALIFNNPGPIGLASSGPRNLGLTGNGTGDTLAAVLGDGGGPTTLTKNGPGTWILTGTNTYSGGTTLIAGQLNVGAGGSGGTLGLGPVVNNTTIDINRTGTLTVGGAISGSGSVTSDGTGTIILANNNSYQGGTTVNAGTLQIGNGGGSGSLFSGGAIVDNSLVVFNTSGTFNYSGNGLISGTGNVIVQGGGTQAFIGANSYTGWTRIDSGSTFQPCQGNTGGLTSSVVTNNGTLRLVRQDTGVFIYPGNIAGSGRLQVGGNNNNNGNVTLTGSNNIGGGIFIGEGALILGDNATPGSGAIAAANAVSFVNNFLTGDDLARTIDFNRVDDFTISANIVTNFTTPQNNLGIVQLDGAAHVTLTGNNSYGSGTIVNGGSLQIGNGGSTGSVGTGPVTINNGNNGLPLLINRSGALAIPGIVSGGFDLNVIGGVTLTLSGANTYSGVTTVTNSSLFVNGASASASIYVTNGVFGGVGTIAGPVTLDAKTTLYGSSSPAPGAIGALTINNDLTLGGSNFVFEVNRSAAPSNSMVAVSGTLTSSGPGFLIVTNVGPNLQPGDRFVLFSQPLPNGALINVSGGRATWTNGLAVDGSIGVVTVSPPPILNVTNLGNGSLRFSWVDSQSVFKLQWQTNFLSVGLTGNWKDYPGGGSSPVTVPIIKTNATAGTAFFRIISVP